MSIEQTTAAAIKATDAILADVKKRGTGMQYMNKEKTEEMRQRWISTITKAILEESR